MIDLYILVCENYMARLDLELDKILLESRDNAMKVRYKIITEGITDFDDMVSLYEAEEAKAKEKSKGIFRKIADIIMGMFDKIKTFFAGKKVNVAAVSDDDDRKILSPEEFQEKSDEIYTVLSDIINGGRKKALQYVKTKMDTDIVKKITISDYKKKGILDKIIDKYNGIIDGIKNKFYSITHNPKIDDLPEDDRKIVRQLIKKQRELTAEALRAIRDIPYSDEVNKLADNIDEADKALSKYGGFVAARRLLESHIRWIANERQKDPSFDLRVTNIAVLKAMEVTGELDGNSSDRKIRKSAKLLNKYKSNPRLIERYNKYIKIKAEANEISRILTQYNIDDDEIKDLLKRVRKVLKSKK